ncbi:unnamed protein product, partial [Symbiodinium sp. CCMP2592]
MWEEMKGLPGAKASASAGFLSTLHRLRSTGHESRLGDVFEEFGLSANVPLSFVEVGLQKKHPILRVRDFITTLDSKGKLDLLLCGNTPATYLKFWDTYRKTAPEHPVFGKNRKDLSLSVPVWLHADEGTGPKRRPVMVVQYQPLLGKGTSRGGQGLNYVGNSLTTRFLFSIMAARLYSGPLKKNRPLLKLVHEFALDMGSCYDEPISLPMTPEFEKITLVPLGLKGDLVALNKLGGLTRNFQRDTWSNEDGPGICHLCSAGQLGHAWHDVSYENMLSMRQDSELPWESTPSLIAELPVDPGNMPGFFRLDVFHIMHKGLLGDVAANTIAACYDCDLFAQSSYVKHLDFVYWDLQQFCTQNKLDLHMNALTKGQLGMNKASDYPSASLGNDTTSLCVYLEAKLKDVFPTISACDRDYFFNMLACLENGNKLMRLMYHSKLWLSKAERSSMIVHFRNLLTAFVSCAQHAYNRQMCRFKLQPKYHCAGEILFGLEHDHKWGKPSLNPISSAVQMDEDYIGRI